MNDLDFLKNLHQAEKALGFSNKQLSGAVTVQLLKQVLTENGLTCSERDVFIREIPIEIDLLLVKEKAKPEYGCLWNPEDVIAAFELKKSGLFGEEGKIKVNSDFGRIRTYHPHIRLFYITISETQSKKATILKSDDSFTFFTRRGHKYSSTGDYDRLIESIRKVFDSPFYSVSK